MAKKIIPVPVVLGEAQEAPAHDLTEVVSVGEYNVVEESTGEGKPKKLIVRGHFGNSNESTANNRYYPQTLWEREIGRLSNPMKSLQVFGELDHPCLLDSDFDIFTPSGWVQFKDIKLGDKVWSRKDGKAVASSVEAVTDQPYDGEAYTVKGRSIDVGFTPAHRILFKHRPDSKIQGDYYATMSEVAAAPGKFSHDFIPKTAEYFSEGVKVFTIPGVTDAGRCKNDVTKDLNIDSNIFSAFMGLYLSEGHCVSEKSDSYNVFISQKNEWSKSYMRDEVLNKMSPDLVWNETDTGFQTADARLYKYVQKLGDAYSKYVPEEVKKLPVASLKELLFWFTIGDGRAVSVHHDKTSKLVTDWKASGTSFKALHATALREDSIPNVRQDVFSVSKKLISDLHECLIRSGSSGTTQEIITEVDYEFAGRTIKAANKVPLHQLHFSTADGVYIDPRFTKIEKIHHSGNIYCITATHGNFLMRKNGHTMWTGNSDGKTMLSRASHVITGLKIEGTKVMGEATILPTTAGNNLAALLKSGCKVGISSRGFGSTKPGPKGEDVVQEDYKLVTFDFVADPAAGAFPAVFFESSGNKVPAHLVTADQLRHINPSLVEEIAKETIETYTKSVAGTSKVVEKAKASLRDEFAKELAISISEAKASLRDEVKLELLNDPSVAGAKSALESIKSLLTPYILPKDVATTLAQKDSLIATANKSLETAKSKLESHIEDADKEIEALAGTLRTVGYKYYLETLISNNKSAGIIRGLVGDVDAFDNSDDLKAKVEELASEIQANEQKQAKTAKAAAQVEVEKARLEVESVQKTSDARLEAFMRESEESSRIMESRLAKSMDLLEGYQSKLATLESELQESRNDATAREIRNYAEAKLTKHPKAAKIQQVMESVTFNSTSDVDSFFSKFRDEVPNKESLEVVKSRVRELTRGGRTVTPLDEEAPIRREAGRPNPITGLAPGEFSKLTKL